MKKIVLTSLLCLLAANTAFAANSVAVTAAAALGPNNGGTACGGGMCGLAVTLDRSTNAAKVVDNTPNDEGPYRADFWFDANTLSLDVTGERFILARGTELTLGRSAFQLLVNKDAGIFRFSIRAGTNNSSAFRFSPRIDYDADCGGVRLQVEFERSPTAGQPLGEVTVTLLEVENAGGACSMVPGTFINTAQIHGNGLNNSNINVDDHHLGGVGGLTANMVGTFYVDEHRSFRTLAP